MRRFLVVLLAALVVPLAAPVAADDPVTVLPWDLIDCRYVYATVALPKAVLVRYLPPGFVPVGPIGVANLAIETDVCASGSGSGGPVAGMTYASIWVPVEPPQALKRPGAGGHFVNFDVLVPDADRRNALAATGIRAVDGNITTAYAPDGSTPIKVALTLDGLGTIGIDIVGPPAQPSGIGGTFTQFTQGDDDRLVRWQTDWRTTRAGQGAATVRVPPDSWLAAAYGAPVVAGRAFYGTWSYTDGDIEFPLHNPTA